MIFGNNTTRRNNGPTTPLRRAAAVTPRVSGRSTSANVRRSTATTTTTTTGNTTARSNSSVNEFTPRNYPSQLQLQQKQKIADLTAEVQDLQIECLQYQQLTKKTTTECNIVVTKLHSKLLESERTNVTLREELTAARHALQMMKMELELQRERFEKAALQSRVAELLESASREIRSPSSSLAPPGAAPAEFQKGPPAVAAAAAALGLTAGASKSSVVLSPQQPHEDAEGEADFSSQRSEKSSIQAAGNDDDDEGVGSTGGGNALKQASVARKMNFESPTASSRGAPSPDN